MFSGDFGSADAEFVPTAGVEDIQWDSRPCNQADLPEILDSSLGQQDESSRFGAPLPNSGPSASQADVKQAYLELLQQQLAQASQSFMPFMFPGYNMPQWLQMQLFLAQQQAQTHQLFGLNLPSSPSQSGPFNPNLNMFNPPSPFNMPSSPQPMMSPTIDFSMNGSPSSTKETKPKYKAKRTKTRHSRSIDLERSRVAQARARDDSGKFLPASKMQKTDLKDLETQLATSEFECNKLRNNLSAKDEQLEGLKLQLDQQLALNEQTQIQLSKMMMPQAQNTEAFGQLQQLQVMQQNLEQQHRQIQMQYDQIISMQQQQILANAMNDLFDPSNPNSPASRSNPSTPMNLVDDLMDTESLDQVAVSETEDMDSPLDDLQRKQSLYEKLKKLGGPPSDVYYPYWPGFVGHPAFMQKEDWINMALRPTPTDPNILEQERRRYEEAQRLWQQEQQQIAELLKEHPELLHSSGALAWRQGYWSGNWVPTVDKIDLTRVQLRKTPTKQGTGMPGQTHPYFEMPRSPLLQEYLRHHRSEALANNSNMGPDGQSSPLGTRLPMSPTPTAQIWREALSNPEFLKMHHQHNLFLLKQLQEQHQAMLQEQHLQAMQQPN